uniref:Uncharacterized protein n=1 Tax=Cacopsylla melanoneura TaxID=428564 RepID=A0A8D9FHB3_9HEMI
MARRIEMIIQKTIIITIKKSLMNKQSMKLAVNHLVQQILRKVKCLNRKKMNTKKSLLTWINQMTVNLKMTSLTVIKTTNPMITRTILMVIKINKIMTKITLMVIKIKQMLIKTILTIIKTNQIIT